MSRTGGHESALPESDLQRLWEAARPEIDRRLGVIERCASAWRAGTMDQAAWRAAARAAHQLAGSLGVLEQREALELARRLNHVFDQDAAPNQLEQAPELLTALRLEIARPPSPPSVAVPRETRREARSSHLVLLAEDDRTIAAAVQVSLGLDGIEVVWARDGTEALLLARELHPTLILLDLDLPVVDGLEVCRRLRSDARMRSIQILLVTGEDTLNRGAADLLAPYVDDFLAKPFRVAELRNHVRTLLARAEAAPET
jgi:CheY-like chemotaxis protein